MCRLRSLRCLTLALVALCLSSAPWVVILRAASPGIVETNTKLSTMSDETITLTVTAGNAVGIIYDYFTNGTRTVTTISGDNGDTFTSQGHYNCGTARCVDLWMDFSSAGGSPVTYTLDQSSTHSNYAIIAFEMDCSAGTCSLDTAGSDGVNTTTATTHYMAPANELDLVSDTTWVGACAGDASFSTRTETSGFQTDLTNFGAGGGLQVFWQYEDDISTGFTDERGQWTSGTARSSWCRAWGIKIGGGGGGSIRPLLMGVW